MKYLKIYENYYWRSDMSNMIYYFKNHDIKTIDGWVCDIIGGDYFVWNKKDYKVYISPFYNNRENMVMHLSINGGHRNLWSAWEERIEKSYSSSSNEDNRLEFFNWYLDEYVPDLLKLAEDTIKTINIIDVITKLMGDVIKIDDDINGVFIEWVGGEVMDRKIFSDNIRYDSHTRSIHVFNSDRRYITIFNKIYDYLIDKYPNYEDISAAYELGFFPKKKS